MSIQKYFKLLFLAVAVLIAGTVKAQTLSADIEAIADIIVDPEGSGENVYNSVQAGLNAIPDNSDEKTIVFVKKGVYHEKVILYHTKWNVVLVGEDVDSTIITNDDYGNGVMLDPSDPNSGGHTFSTYTFRADPEGFQAFNITFENPTKSGQGVAFHSNGDKQILYHCKLLGFQDTYFDNFRTRRYFKDCMIAGGTDFIFGWGVTLFDSCQIHARESGAQYTASATPEHYEFGHVFKDCHLTCRPEIKSSVSLGRPWFPYANTMFFECWENSAINTSGWSTWSGRESTCIYQEYNCYGPGYSPGSRQIGTILDASLAERYHNDTILAASNFPSDMGPVVDSLEFWSVRNRFENSGYVARADTILYAARDTFPEYPTDNWSPVIYDPVYQIITQYEKHILDSANKRFTVDSVYIGDRKMTEFDFETLMYFVDFPKGTETAPALTAYGENFSRKYSYPSTLPGTAALELLSADKTYGGKYNIYISIDSSYWSTAPEYARINSEDTLAFEKGVYEYDYTLKGEYTKISSFLLYKFPNQRYNINKPSTYPGVITILMTAPSGDTATYSINVHDNPISVQAVMNDDNKLVFSFNADNSLLINSQKDINEISTLCIYDLNGKKVCEQRLASILKGQNYISIDKGNISSGMYVYQLTTAGASYSGKLMKR